jgi:hypothetical protein
MQSGGLMDFGDSPNDVLKWTRERESQKKSSTSSSDSSTKKYGEWESPITSKLVAGKATPLARYCISASLYALSELEAAFGFLCLAYS